MGLVTLAPLRHPPFRRFWIGAALSNIGTWMETVALGYYVADQTRLAVWSAVIAAAGFVPIVVCSTRAPAAFFGASAGAPSLRRGGAC